MISTRTLNTIQDEVLDCLNQRQIERLFEDNGIRKSWWVKYSTKRGLYSAYLETLNTFISEETKLLFVAEAVEKIYKENDIVAYPDGHLGTAKKNHLITLLKKDGYELIEGKLIAIDNAIHTIQAETPVSISMRLYNELKDKKNDNPLTLVGISKDLLESLFKAICDKRSIAYDKKDQFDALAKKALVEMEWVEAECTEKKKTEAYMQQMITIIALKINEIRNIHGLGHGKEDGYQPIPLETARLVANLSVSIATFLIPQLAKL